MRTIVTSEHSTRRPADRARRLRDASVVSCASSEALRDQRALGLSRRRRDAHRRDAGLDDVGGRAGYPALTFMAALGAVWRAAVTSATSSRSSASGLASAPARGCGRLRRLPGDATSIPTRCPALDVAPRRGLPAGDHRQPAGRADGGAARAGRPRRRDGDERRDGRRTSRCPSSTASPSCCSVSPTPPRWPTSATDWTTTSTHRPQPACAPIWLKRGPWAAITSEAPPAGTLVVDSLSELVERIGDWWEPA